MIFYAHYNVFRCVLCSYFIAVPHGRPGQRHLYRTSEKSSNSTVVGAPLCITCPRGTSLSELRKQGRKPSADHHYAHLQHTKDMSSDGTVLFPSTSHKSSSQSERSMMISHGSYSASITDMMILNVSVILNTSASGQPNSNNNRTSTPGSVVSSSRSGGGSGISNSATGVITSVRGIKKVIVKVSPCLYNSVKFSPKKSFFVRECLGPTVPYVTLHSAPSGRLIFILNNNTELREKVNDLALPDIRTFFVETTGGYFAPVRLYLPPGLREDEEFKFPMVLHT